MSEHPKCDGCYTSALCRMQGRCLIVVSAQAAVENRGAPKLVGSGALLATPRTSAALKRASGMFRAAAEANGFADAARDIERDNARLREAGKQALEMLRDADMQTAERMLKDFFG